MKIVVLDGFAENPGDLSWDGLRALGELTVYDRTPVGDGAEILRRIGDAEAVYTNKTPLTAEIIGGAAKLRFIGVLATGYNVVDTAAAAQRGIPVCNVPSYGTRAVAQFTMALLLELCHHAAHHSREVHRGRWSACPDFCFWDTPQVELAGKTMGIIGFGRIGQATAALARAFGMEVLAFDPQGDPAAAQKNCRLVGLEQLLAEADVISLHCPLLPSTRGIIGRETIAKMKDGVLLLNTARGPLVDEQALREALDSGKVRAAGVDVVSVEPIREDNPLLGAENCVITPHISWAARESRQRLMDTAVENLRAFLAGHPVNVVNG